jgi:hypothetical protein
MAVIAMRVEDPTKQSQLTCKQAFDDELRLLRRGVYAERVEALLAMTVALNGF